MPGFFSIGISIALCSALAAGFTSSGRGRSSGSGCSQDTCTAASMNLLQRVQSRSRLDAASESAPGDAGVSSSTGIPFDAPFYLKSAEHPELYVGPEDQLGHSGAGHLTFSGGSMHSGAQFLAEDADAGRFYLKSEENPEMYVGAEGDKASGHFTWLSRDGRARFAVERANGSEGRFYLKSGDYADAYVQGDEHEALLNTSLVFAPFLENTSIQFTVESVLGHRSHDDAGEIDSKYCDQALVGGKHSKVISDSAINVTSENPRDGNLMNEKGTGDGAPHGWGGKDSRIDDTNSAWLPEHLDSNQYIQWDFGELKQINKIRTLGRPHRGKAGDDQWVSEFNISYTTDLNETWTFFNQTFQGNHDRETHVENEFYPPIEARFVRLHTLKWHSRSALRAELYGCTGAVTPAPPIVCASCARCEAVPGEDERHDSLTTKCPLCAYGMLSSWPCNVTDLCRCAEKDEVRGEWYKVPRYKQIPVPLPGDDIVSEDAAPYDDVVESDSSVGGSGYYDDDVLPDSRHGSYDDDVLPDSRQDSGSSRWAPVEPGRDIPSKL